MDLSATSLVLIIIDFRPKELTSNRGPILIAALTEDISPMLDDIKVLDVTQVVSGSFASMMIADLGADVVKIERPSGGDISRHSPPFVGDFSSYFMSVNRNKKSVSLDLKSEEGSKLFLDLVEKADVVLENFTPGAMEKFGIDYDSVTEVNPEIIYCSITGFGQTGPYAKAPALDIIAQAMSGNMSITGPQDSKPYRAGIPIADLAGSMFAVQSIIAALYHRTRTGEGQYIDVSMLEGILSWLTVRAGYTFATDEPYPRMGNELDEFVPYGIFETKDSYLAIVTVQDHHWEKLCEAIDRPELASDDRFATTDKRRENRTEVRELLLEELQQKGTDKWFDIMRNKGVPSGPVYNTKEVWEDEHVKTRDLLHEIDANGEQFNVIKYPVKFSEYQTGIEQGAPRVGEDSRSQVRELGYDEEMIENLIKDGIIGTPDNDHPDR